MNEIINLELEASEAEIWALAEFVKRVGFSEFKQNAVDENEAYLIQASVTKLQTALALKGYSPR